uniref:L-threonylcarbamoyladenylate synthase n=1 Tax=Sphingomonas bacterium TaxID=1895847 RepID=UPI0015761866
LAASGRPLAAPSANASNGLSPTTAGHVVASLGDTVPLVIDDGPCAAGLESTIVHARRVLRPGPITDADLNPDNRGSGAGRLDTGPSQGRIVAPGQLASHYAPGKPLRLDVIDAARDEYLIGFGPVAGDETLSAAGNPVEAAANLFAALHRADASDRARIAVAPIPRDGLGEAINDRLARAATR